eukprot:5513413-Pleurochrysis_carterae.AAC.4
MHATPVCAPHPHHALKRNAHACSCASPAPCKRTRVPLAHCHACAPHPYEHCTRMRAVSARSYAPYIAKVHCVEIAILIHLRQQPVA